MKRLPLMRGAALLATAAAVGGCGSARAVSATTPTAATAVATTGVASGVEPPVEVTDQTSAERWAEAKMAQQSAAPRDSSKESLDPLAVGGSLEASAVPKVVTTPPKELRTKTRGDLDAGLASVKNAKTLTEATSTLTARLGKPTWIENEKRRIWVARDGKQCHRLVLDSDGSLEVETAAVTERRTLSATAQQNPCTGEIERGAPGAR